LKLFDLTGPNYSLAAQHISLVSFPQVASLHRNFYDWSNLHSE